MLSALRAMLKAFVLGSHMVKAISMVQQLKNVKTNKLLPPVLQVWTLSLLEVVGYNACIGGFPL